MRITLGLDDPASWVYSLPDSMHVNQFRVVMPGPDMVFSQEVRQAAEGYIEPAAAEGLGDPARAFSARS